MKNEPGNEALTGLEIIILTAFLCIFIYLCASVVFGAVMPDIFSKNKNAQNSAESPGGIIGFATDETAEILIRDGTCYGAQNKGGVFEGVELIPKEPVSANLGACTIPLRLSFGKQISINLEDAVILFRLDSDSQNTEELKYSDLRPLPKSSWTIADKSGLIPLASADSDNILEPNEIFTILVYPKFNVEPYQKFSVDFTPKSLNPLNIAFTVPPQIISQRIVELNM